MRKIFTPDNLNILKFQDNNILKNPIDMFQ